MGKSAARELTFPKGIIFLGEMGERIQQQSSLVFGKQEEASAGVSYAVLPPEERISVRLGELMIAQAVFLQRIRGLEGLCEVDQGSLRADAVLDTIVDQRGMLDARDILKQVRSSVVRSRIINGGREPLLQKISELMGKLRPEPQGYELPDLPVKP